MCHDCRCRTRITHGDENLRQLAIMMNSGSAGLDKWQKNFALEELTMEQVVALRHQYIDPEETPILALELDALIAAAENKNYR